MVSFMAQNGWLPGFDEVTLHCGSVASDFAQRGVFRIVGLGVNIFMLENLFASPTGARKAIRAFDRSPDPPSVQPMS